MIVLTYGIGHAQTYRGNATLGSSGMSLTHQAKTGPEVQGGGCEQPVLPSRLSGAQMTNKRS